MMDIGQHAASDARRLAARRVAYHIQRAEADLQYALVDLSIAGNFVAHARLAGVVEDLIALQGALSRFIPFDDQRKEETRARKFAYADESAA